MVVNQHDCEGRFGGLGRVCQHNASVVSEGFAHLSADDFTHLRQGCFVFHWCHVERVKWQFHLGAQLVVRTARAEDEGDQRPEA